MLNCQTMVKMWIIDLLELFPKRKSSVPDVESRRLGLTLMPRAMALSEEVPILKEKKKEKWRVPYMNVSFRLKYF